MGQQLREGRKLPTVRPDVDVGYGDAPFLRGGSPVIVARRPPSATAFNVVAACPGAALTALGARRR